jgi:hypothetical protein
MPLSRPTSSDLNVALQDRGRARHDVGVPFWRYRAGVPKDHRDQFPVGVCRSCRCEQSIAGASFGEISSLWPPTFAPAPPRHVTLPAFVVAFLSITPVAYIFLLKEGEDYLTPLRKQLRGTWAVYYQDWQVNAMGQVISKEENDIAKIDINVVARKLYIHSSLHNSDVFKDYDRNIENISINATSKPIEIILFYRLNLSTHSGALLEGDVFVKLTLEFDENNKPIRMAGRWYDLDGGFARSKREFFKQLIGKEPVGEFEASGTLRYEKV